MRALKTLFVLGPIGGAFFIGMTAIDQFENYRAEGVLYVTPFHTLNIIGLTALTVALLAFAICVAIDKIDIEDGFTSISLSDYLWSVLLGTVGASAVGVALFEKSLNHEFSRYGEAQPYHGGDMFGLFVVGALAVLAALYLLFKEDEEEESEDESCSCTYCRGACPHPPVTPHPGCTPYGYPVYSQIPFYGCNPYGYPAPVIYGGSPFVYPVVETAPPRSREIGYIIVDDIIVESDETGKEYEVSGYVLTFDGEIVEFELDAKEVKDEEPDERSDKPAESDEPQQS